MRRHIFPFDPECCGISGAVYINYHVFLFELKQVHLFLDPESKVWVSFHIIFFSLGMFIEFGAWFPHTNHPSLDVLANISSLVCVGCICSILLLTS